MRLRTAIASPHAARRQPPCIRDRTGVTILWRSGRRQHLRHCNSCFLPRTRGEAGVWLRSQCAHRCAFSSARRPAAVIRTLATSIVREPAVTRSALDFARPAWTSSTMSLIANPCACRMPSGQPLSQDASNSSARMRSGLMSRRRCGGRIVSSLPGSYRFNRHRGTLFQRMEPNSSLAIGMK
jgi:hypothetical protein